MPGLPTAAAAAARRFRAVALLLLAAATGACALREQPPAPDLVLTGGKVFTADAAHPWAEAVAIRGERIVAVGTTADVARLADAHTRRIALGGRVAIPGFDDAHDHVGAAEYGVRFGTTPSPTPDPDARLLLDSLRAVVRRVPRGTWLHTTVGPRIFDDTTVRRALLDRVAPDHPVLLDGWTGHDAIVNSAGLRALAIADDARDPIGGRYVRDAAGRLTGALEDYALWDAQRRQLSALPDSVLVAYLRRYAADAVRLGVTSVQDMNGDFDPATTARVFRAARLPIRMRIIPYPMTDATGLRAAEWRVVDARLAPRVVVSGVKWILDGTPVEERAFMRAPYADRPGWRGALQFPRDTVRAILAHALATREPLHLHVSGDSTPRVVFSLMEALAPDSAWRPLRVRIEHGDWVTGDLIPVARRLGVVIVQNPAHFATDAALLRRRFGRVPEGIFAVRSLLAAGVPLGIGSDGARNPFVNLMLAVTNPDDPREALTREQAVTAYTRGSAYAELAEREKGTLAPGMLADLAVLSQDIFTVPVERLPATESVLTIVGGEVVWDRLTGAGRQQS